jgi:hypothetical protein
MRAGGVAASAALDVSIDRESGRGPAVRRAAASSGFACLVMRPGISGRLTQMALIYREILLRRGGRVAEGGGLLNRYTL